ncbi:MAG: hypothetical protein IJC73_08740, partial [Lentisphaeria bacterium]|nr:hypothetical protein [Lentisphaeria bacterium]
MENLVAFFTPGQAIGADRSGIWRSQSEACRGGLSRRSSTKPEELRSNPKPGNTAQIYNKPIPLLFSPYKGNQRNLVACFTPG